MIANADRVLKMAREDTKIIPGHSPLAQVIDSKPTAQFDEVWGKGFLNPQRFTEMLYKSAKKK